MRELENVCCRVDILYLYGLLNVDVFGLFSSYSEDIVLVKVGSEFIEVEI